MAQEFIPNAAGQSFYLSPDIAPLSLRKYCAGINTTNDVFQIQDGTFFIMSRTVTNDNEKNRVYFIDDTGSDWRVSYIDITTGDIDNFVINGGEW